MRGGRIQYSIAEMSWLEANRTMVISDYYRAFQATFARLDVTAANLHGLRKRKGWKVGRAKGRFAGRKQRRRMPVSAVELEWLKNNCTLPIADYHIGFCAEFSRVELTAEQLHSLRKREGWRTGRNGRFGKGAVPWSKGKKIGTRGNAARTQFKKGQRPPNAKYVGHERIDKQTGYVLISIDEKCPWRGTSPRYVPKQHVLWKRRHGPLPDGMVLKCKGDRANPDPSNWEAVPRGLLPRLNNRWGRGYDTAPDELKPTIMAVAKLEHKLREKVRGRDETATPNPAATETAA